MKVPDPSIINPQDAIIKMTTTAICGSDLHLYDGYIPTMEKGDILGHEFMGEVVEVGRSVQKLKKGDRVVVPFTIAIAASGAGVELLAAAGVVTGDADAGGSSGAGNPTGNRR